MIWITIQVWVAAFIQRRLAVRQIGSNDAFTYTPENGFRGTDSFTYYTTDGMDNSAVKTVTLLIENIAPIAVIDSHSTSQMITLTVTADGVLGNDSDADGDELTAVLDTDTTYGQLNLNSDGTFIYTPESGFRGTDTFAYYADDNMDVSTIVTVTLTVNNIAPTSITDTYSTLLQEQISVPMPGVSGNDYDSGGDEITAVLDSTVTHGQFSLNSDGSFTYTADSGFTGADSFTYYAADGTDHGDTVTVTLQVQPAQIFLPMIMR